jgi:rhodanese-related sulfurtransferase
VNKMKKNIIMVTIAVSILLSTFSGAFMQSACAANHSATSGDELKIVVLSTDKDVYSAQEEMDILLSVYSPEHIKDALIKVSGVKSKKGVYFVSYSSKIDLFPGLNHITFTKKLPECSSCAGIDQGTYCIEASVSCDDKIVNTTHSIAITAKPNQIIPVNIVVEETKQLTDTEDDIIVLDVRTKEEFDSGHIKGALSIPLPELSNRTGELNMSNKIVVYSANGNNSTVACNILIKNGSTRVYKVSGGINAWNESGYPIVTPEMSHPEIPGFEAIFALGALVIVAYCLWRKNVW